MADLHLIVSDELKKKIAGRPNTETLEVVFEKLVDQPMPPLGNFAWHDSVLGQRALDPAAELDELPDVIEYHSTIGQFWEVLPANLYELREMGSDVNEVDVNFGSYSDVMFQRVAVSRSVLEIYPVVWGDVLQVRGDMFAEIAPYLDLDYFDIARIDLDVEGPNALIEAFINMNLDS
jgi:hypothetical protein